MSIVIFYCYLLVELLASYKCVESVYTFKYINKYNNFANCNQMFILMVTLCLGFCKAKLKSEYYRCGYSNQIIRFLELIDHSRSNCQTILSILVSIYLQHQSVLLIITCLTFIFVFCFFISIISNFYYFCYTGLL